MYQSLHRAHTEAEGGRGYEGRALLLSTSKMPIERGPAAFRESVRVPCPLNEGRSVDILTFHDIYITRKYIRQLLVEIRGRVMSFRYDYGIKSNQSGRKFLIIKDWSG